MKTKVAGFSPLCTCTSNGNVVEIYWFSLLQLKIIKKNLEKNKRTKIMLCKKN